MKNVKLDDVQLYLIPEIIIEYCYLRESLLKSSGGGESECIKMCS